MAHAEIDYGAALAEQTRMFAELVSGRDMSVQVPTTPGLSLEQLTAHLGHMHKWSSQIVARRSEMSADTLADMLAAPVDPTPIIISEPADYTAETIQDWLPGTAQAVIDAVKQEGPDAPVWTMIGPRPAGFWLRRRLHEAAQHRADAAIALGADYTLAPELAADGIGEHLERVVAQAGGLVGSFQGPVTYPLPLDEGQALRLRPTDVEHDGWAIVRDGERVAFAPGYDGDATELRGPAADLLLTLIRRRDVGDTAIEVAGDPGVLANWLSKTPY
jgi:uncharacterized protein (TIGR03083 family)